ncbi:acyltransferase [Hyalangium versicolor]|uniref:acyltransferase n=1 Tax=Hyalangium versicolor TaxID=2861190 RepID=UPI001CD02793|nr:acyltransferase [Hyalangium versicolor]
MTSVTAPLEKAPAPRMVWLDANRVLAAVGIILIHSSTNFSGDPFKSPEPGMNLATALVRTFAELSGAEIFLVFSLFLLAHRLDKRDIPYGSLIRGQAKRLLIPFLIWTLFFAVFRLVKASAFGYGDAIRAELLMPRSWAGYLLIGSAQYHLHFLPTLFFAILFYPCMRMARRYPLMGLLLVPLLYLMDFVQRWMWGYISDPFVRGLALQGVKNLGYLGYGMMAFSLHAYWKRGMDRAESRDLLRMMLLLGGFAFLTTLVYGIACMEAGSWVDRNGAAFYAHLLMPVIVFCAFMATQHRAWPPLFSKLSPYTFGVYLLHPIVIDLFDTITFTERWNLSPLAMIFSKFAVAVLGAFALAYGLGKLRPFAFMIGIEESAPARKAVAPEPPPAAMASSSASAP